MPSPLAHTAMAVLIAPVVLRGLPAATPLGPRLALVGAVAFGTVAADLDIAIGYARGHNGFAVHGEITHSIVVALAFAVVFALVAPLAVRGGGVEADPERRSGLSRSRALAAGLLAYGSHLLLDFFNHGRGVMLLWPLSDQRFASPVRIFYGVRHSDLTDLSQHAVTLGTELLFALGVVLMALPLYLRRSARGGG